MNRDYGVWAAQEIIEEPEAAPAEIPEVLDYYVTVCAVCHRPDNVVEVDVHGILTYAHYTCTPELLDNPMAMR